LTGPLVEITHVVLPSHAPIRYAIESPTIGTTSQIYGFLLEGWVAGGATTIQILEPEYGLVCDIPVDVNRTDVAHAFPDVARTRAGFRGLVGILGLPRSFELFVRSAENGRSHQHLATVRGAHELLETDFAPTLEPVMVTSLGRSGSTYLMNLLSCHQEIAVEPRYPFEFNGAQYWMRVLRMLIDPQERGLPSVLGALPPIPYYQLNEGSAQDHAIAAAAMCQRQVEHLYRRVCDHTHKPSARFFAEKQAPGPLQWITWDLYRGAKELFLVRDIRDVACSILAFDQKRGFYGFGRHETETAADYVVRLRNSAASVVRAWRHRRSRAQLVRYEDLVHEPIDTLRDAFKYLGVECGTSFVTDLVRRAVSRSREWTDHQTSATPASSIGRYSRDLPKDLRATCTEAFGEFLEEFEYI
jgi:Sulfotransferase family